jgi:tetratricopeptide (TPR) repeat protein
VAAAAILREGAQEWPAARALWSRLAATTERQDGYVAALVRFNLGRCAKQCGDAAQSREAIVGCVRLLEEVADHFESIGQRERAFDCFQVLAELGREGGAFEDVLEGSVNCIRILREDNLKRSALEYYEESITCAAERGEISAAATLAREAAEYARSIGLASTATAYAVRQAELWYAVAKRQIDRGAPGDITESALLGAALAFGEVGQFAKVAELYAELAQLDLLPSRREHYVRAARRYSGAANEPIDVSNVLSHPPRLDPYFSAVWHMDLLEWEQQGSAAEACADALFDKRWPELIRRKAMLARLTAIRVEGAPQDDASVPVVDARVRLADQLAQLQLFTMLSPLEKLFACPVRRVKIAVLRAMQTLPFKRSFVTVRAGLRDPDAAVVEQAAKTVEALYFEHAFDPLARIVRESAEATVRASALRALARIDTPEAAEFMLGMLEHGSSTDGLAALEALKATPGSKFVELARTALQGAPEPLRANLRQVLAGRGMTS